MDEELPIQLKDLHEKLKRNVKAKGETYYKLYLTEEELKGIDKDLKQLDGLKKILTCPYCKELIMMKYD